MLEQLGVLGKGIQLLKRCSRIGTQIFLIPGTIHFPTSE
jgi:hypothetical protein